MLGIVAGYTWASINRADQGWVKASDGTVWKLKRMQTFGMTGEYMAVYDKK